MDYIRMSKFESDAGVTGEIIKSVFIVLMFMIGHLYFSPILYIASFLIILLFILDCKNIVALTLFFIPLARVLKLSPTSSAVISYAILCGLIALLGKTKYKIARTEFFIGFFIFALLILKNLFGNFGFPFSYIRLVISLMLLPEVLILYKRNTIKFDLRESSIMAFGGIIMATLIGVGWAQNSHLAPFIATEDVYHYGGIVMNRFCGLSSDPNYFASLALFAIALLIVCLIITEHIIYMILAVIVSGIGILTLSKMFLLIMFVLWFFGLLTILKGKAILKKNKNSKIRIFIIVFLGLIIGSVWFVNSGYLNVILSRFGNNGAYGMTTGRSEIWKIYLERIFSKLNYMIVGASTSDEMVDMHVTHNTIIQLLWKFGIFGFGLIVFWFVRLYLRIRNKIYCKKYTVVVTRVILIAQLLPILALDKIFFDEFYWYYIIYLLSQLYIDKLYKKRGDKI